MKKVEMPLLIDIFLMKPKYIWRGNGVYKNKTSRKETKID